MSEADLRRIENKLDSIAGDVTAVKVGIAKQPCEVHRGRIKVLEKVVFGFIAVVMLAFLASVVNPWGSAIRKKNTGRQVNQSSAIASISPEENLLCVMYGNLN